MRNSTWIRGLVLMVCLSSVSSPVDAAPLGAKMKRVWRVTKRATRATVSGLAGLSSVSGAGAMLLGAGLAAHGLSQGRPHDVTGGFQIATGGAAVAAASVGTFIAINGKTAHDDDVRRRFKRLQAFKESKAEETKR